MPPTMDGSVFASSHKMHIASKDCSAMNTGFGKGSLLDQIGLIAAHNPFIFNNNKSMKKIQMRQKYGKSERIRHRICRRGFGSLSGQ
jgi:hypothetical protein